jgi:processive 1,2-diacylglycerol beta-glucosyltransferase
MEQISGKQKVDILLVSAGVGAGHNQAARAIIEGLRLASPALNVQMIDMMDFAPRWFRAYYAGGFAIAMTHLSWAYGLGYALSNRPNQPGRSIKERFRLMCEWLSMGRFRRFIADLQPTLIINTHFLAPPIIHRMQSLGQLASRQVTAMTDNDVHRWWYSQGVDHWFVPADFSAKHLELWGIAPADITVSGIAIHPKWTQNFDRQTVLDQWHLPADKQIVVLTGGTEFTCGPIAEIADGILQTCPQAAVVVLAGRNKPLLAKLSAHSQAGTRLFPQGFTDRSQELISVCSLIVTKAGGITTAECLATGTPMLLIRPVPGQEGGNAAYLAREGTADIARKTGEILTKVQFLLNNPAHLEEMHRRAKALYRPATQTIAQACLAKLAELKNISSDRP